MNKKVSNHGADRKEGSILQCILLVAVACLVYGVMQGVHDNYGIMLNGLVPTTGLTYAAISFCIGIGAFVYGLAQPFLGMLALRKGYPTVILLGIACMVTGLLVTPFCRHNITMLIFFGLLLPFGTTGLAYGIVMGAITPIIGERRAMAVSGIVQASAGVGDAIMSPALATVSGVLGIRTAMWILTIPFVIMIPIAFWLRSVSDAQIDANNEEEKNLTMKEIFLDAVKNPNYRLILIGFSTCGFNMSIIESHLFSQYLSYGIARTTASLTLTVYGVATMLGAILTGYLGTKIRLNRVLGSVYAVRVFVSLGFLFLPKTVLFAFAATTLLGMSGDSTVPPTTGIITKLFGAKRMTVIYGFALIGHQIGAFLSAYLGGLFVTWGWGYAPLWVLNLILAAVASIASYRIRVDNQFAD